MWNYFIDTSEVGTSNKERVTKRCDKILYVSEHKIAHVCHRNRYSIFTTKKNTRSSNYLHCEYRHNLKMLVLEALHSHSQISTFRGT